MGKSLPTVISIIYSDNTSFVIHLWTLVQRYLFQDMNLTLEMESIGQIKVYNLEINHRSPEVARQRAAQFVCLFFSKIKHGLVRSLSLFYNDWHASLPTSFRCRRNSCDKFHWNGLLPFMDRNLIPIKSRWPFSIIVSSATRTICYFTFQLCIHIARTNIFGLVVYDVCAEFRRKILIKRRARLESPQKQQRTTTGRAIFCDWKKMQWRILSALMLIKFECPFCFHLIADFLLDFHFLSKIQKKSLILCLKQQTT